MVAAQSYRALNWWLSFHGAREMLAWSSDAPSLQNNFSRVVWVDSGRYKHANGGPCASAASGWEPLKTTRPAIPSVFTVLAWRRARPCGSSR